MICLQCDAEVLKERRNVMVLCPKCLEATSKKPEALREKIAEFIGAVLLKSGLN